MTRAPIVIGNWKMELSYKGEVEVVTALKKLLQQESPECDVVVCPSFPTLATAADMLSKNHKIQLGAQNVHFVERGAFTGEISVTHISPFVRWCIVGHSERRTLTGETDEQVGQKAHILLTHGIKPIICIGETASEREAGQTMNKIQAQVQALIPHLTRVGLTNTVIAYEPIWAIGSGETPDPADAAGTMLLIRKVLAEHFGQDGVERLRVVYGGSVSPGNAAAFAEEPGVDGVLVGGASVKPGQFLEIIRALC